MAKSEVTKDMENNHEVSITNVQNEIMLVGALFNKPDLYISYGSFIRSKYDFSDDCVRFFYDCFELFYKTQSQTIDETKFNMFMSAEVERLNFYKKYKGWKTVSSWMKLSDPDDIKNYMTVVKKYSLIREYDRQGYPVQKIIVHPRFNKMTADDIYKLIRSQADKINTIINNANEAVNLTEKCGNQVRSYLIEPDMGIALPWDSLTKMFRGCRQGKVIFNGFLSNEGKTRNLMLLIAYIVLVKKEKFLLLSNEMDEKDLRDCLITTVINNKQFQKLHGVSINKKEGEIVLGIYHDKDGNIISRIKDDKGNFIESEEEYIARVEENSEEYRQVQKVAQWIDSEREGKLFFLDVGDDYSDARLELEFRKHRLLYDVKYAGYDTMKGYGVDDWQTLKQTATKIKEIMKSINMFCWCVFQLTDDTVFTDITALSSNNIANSKGIKHVADCLILGKRIPLNQYDMYRYIPDDLSGQWGEQVEHILDKNKVYFAMKIDKNRGGNKSLIPLFELNLDYNTWVEVGYLVKKEKVSKKKEE